ncbi:MAG: enoyl-CoA hydratase/isomerase family protein [Fimbriimonadaceae bacterium]|nr:enoyl-CoA hydratase/isomerase family protein [Fimbriimonadaceae bacterium]
MLQVTQDGAVLRLTLDRPEVRNALDDRLIAAMADAVGGAPAGTRVIVIEGAGKAFCAGGDLEWMRRAATYTREQNIADAVSLAGLFRGLVESPAVVVAKVHGAAFGGGSGLVCCADVAVAAHGTLFAFSEAKLGLVPATISPYVVGKIGAGHARALFTTAEVFDTDRAQRIGMVHHAVDLDMLDAKVDEVVAGVLRCGPEAVASCKALAQAAPLTAEEAATLLADARAGAEGVEGVAAFLEKRKASFVVEL